MSRYRTELRIVMLVVLALIATVVLHVGIVSAKMDWDMDGIKLSVAGPAVFFVVILLVFHITGLFKQGLEKTEEVSSSPTENLSRGEIERQLDLIEIAYTRLDLRKTRLEAALAAHGEERPAAEVMEAAGLKRVALPWNR